MNSETTLPLSIDMLLTLTMNVGWEEIFNCWKAIDNGSYNENDCLHTTTSDFIGRSTN